MPLEGLVSQIRVSQIRQIRQEIRDFRLKNVKPEKLVGDAKDCQSTTGGAKTKPFFSK